MNPTFRIATAMSLLFFVVSARAEVLTLEQAVKIAITEDPWLVASEQRQSASMAMSEGASYLPDPKFNLGMANFPTDTFNYRQEPMTQMQMGVSQMFPRGDSLALQSEIFLEKSQMMPIQREVRRAQVRLAVSLLWLDNLRATSSIELIEQNRGLFEQLSELVVSSYSNSLGRTRQQDLVRAELELDQLDDRLVQLRQQQFASRAKLSEWIPAIGTGAFELDSALTMSSEQIAERSLEEITQLIAQHPSIRQVAQSIEIADTEVALAEQKYEPEWVLNASYGYRGDDLRGNPRADLFSVGVSVDIPIFSSKRQYAQVQAEIYERESIKTDRLVTLRNLVASYQALSAEIEQLDARLALFNQRLLPGLDEGAEAATNAYTTDDGNFNTVIQARISELNAKLALLAIQTERNKKIAELHYLLTGTSEGDAS